MQTLSDGSRYNIKNFPLFQHYIEEADRYIMFQLLQAFIREGMLKEGIEINNNLDIGAKKIIFPLWNSHIKLTISNYKTASLNRFFDMPIITVQYVDDTEDFELSHAKDLISILENEFSYQNHHHKSWHYFKKEIENAIPNSAMCLKFREDWNKALGELINTDGAQSFWAWALESPRLKNKPLFFEQWGAVGHLYHPCSKTKLGLLPNEVLQYSPEFQGGADILLAAVKKDFLHVESLQGAGNDLSDWLKQSFPVWYEKWQKALEGKGLNIKYYSPMPIHPWQAENELLVKFKKALEEQVIVLFNDVKLSTSSTMSFRTMVPDEPVSAHHIKLPVAIQATSAVRTVSPASVQTGPKLSHILGEIVKKDADISATLRILQEETGAHFICNDEHYCEEDEQRFLSVLFRQNPLSCLGEGENAIVVASLFVNTPDKNIPLLADIMACAGVEMNDDVLSYFNKYVDVVLSGHFDLYIKYGIALEAHQQNTVAVFDKNHQPKAMMARDFGGVRVFAPRLRKAGFQLVPYKEAVTVTHDNREARNKFMHAVMQGHIGEVTICLSKHFNMDEKAFWEIVSSNLRKRFKLLEDYMDNQAYNEERNAFFKDDWSLKALTRMRLEKTSHHYIYEPLKNPLKGL